MSTHKHIDKICLVAALLAIILCALLISGDAVGLQQASKIMGYEDKLFDPSKVHTIDIVMDHWDSFIDTCENEEYAACSVTIDGEAYHNVGIRAKGNTSLSSVSSMGSDRYSFKIEFDQYDRTKSYHGLDKLSLNNLIQDNTMMKDYLTYRMMSEFGAAAPLCSYVYITVNGEDWGLYLAVEAVEDSLLQRNYGKDYGDLYKPDSMNFGGGRGNGKDFNMEDFDFSRMEPFRDQDQREDPPQAESGNWGGVDFPSPPQGDGMQMPDGFDPAAMFGQGSSQTGGRQPNGMDGSFGEFFGMGGGETKLQHTDDDPDSYTNIFSNAKTKVTAADQKRLIQSLKTLSEGKNIESVVDIDQVLRYFVVHNFVVNGDSYTGSMVHNYYLYEEDGKLSMLPWDYNLAFGTFQGRDAGSAVNDPIDTPLSVTGSGDRPMADWIFTNEEYTQMYHQYFAEFLEQVDFADMIGKTADLIASYVEKDPSKFCTFQEFEAGVDTLREFCLLREKSVRGQLDGVIPSTDAGQAADSSALIEASQITLSDMGSMGMGGDRGGNIPGARPGGQKGQMGESQGAPSGDVPKTEVTPMPGTEGALGGPFENAPAFGQMPGNENGNFQFPGGMDAGGQAGSNGAPAVLFAVSVVVLFVGLVIAKKYQR